MNHTFEYVSDAWPMHLRQPGSPSMAPALDPLQLVSDHRDHSPNCLMPNGATVSENALQVLSQ